MESAVIPVRSERQAMDWSLVLASQDIHAVIERQEENKWLLIIEPQHYEKALKTLRLYLKENRGWQWQRDLPWTGTAFHWGGIIWCSLLAIIYRLSTETFPVLIKLASFDSQDVRQGEWWRFFTAILLHADLGHLAANISTGVLFLGLALAQYGAWYGLLIAFCAGAMGNLMGLLLYAREYQGLGASGMIMGALGLISVQAIPAWRSNNGTFLKYLFKAAIAGLFLFIILGTNPNSDIIAHLGGFLGGLILGVLSFFLPQPISESKRIQGTACFMLITLLIVTTLLCLWHR